MAAISGHNVQNDGVWIDGIRSADIQGIHCEFHNGYCINIGPSDNTSAVSVRNIDAANFTGAKGDIGFGANSDSSDFAENVGFNKRRDGSGE